MSKESPRHDPELIADVLRLVRWGWTQRQISQGLGISHGMVTRIIADNRVKRAA